METAIPGTSISVVNGPLPPPPTKIIVIDEGTRRVTGCCYHFGFITLLAALILAIIAIVRDDITKVTFTTSSSGSYSEYCGWQDMHGYDLSSSFLGTPYSFIYSKDCGNDNRACTLEKVGTAWYSLLIIGIVFGGFALIAFVLDFTLPLTCATIMAFDLMFFACMLADALIWGCFKTCGKACNSLDFPNLPSDITNCQSHFAISWILVIIAGGLSFLSSLFLLISRSIANANKQQRYQ